MRLVAAFSCLLLVGVGCDERRRESRGVARASMPSGQDSRWLSVGESVVGRVTADDPRCVGEPQWPCQSFRITAPKNGALKVTMRHAEGNLDVSITDAQRSVWWWSERPAAGLTRVTAPVKAGATYQITVWEYERPGVEFELRTVLHPG